MGGSLHAKQIQLAKNSEKGGTVDLGYFVQAQHLSRRSTC